MSKKEKVGELKKLNKQALVELAWKMTGKIDALKDDSQRSAVECQTLNQENRKLGNTIFEHEKTIERQQSEITGLMRAIERTRKSESESFDRNRLFAEEKADLKKKLEKEKAERSDTERELKIQLAEETRIKDRAIEAMCNISCHFKT